MRTGTGLAVHWDCDHVSGLRGRLDALRTTLFLGVDRSARQQPLSGAGRSAAAVLGEHRLSFYHIHTAEKLTLSSIAKKAC